MFAKKLTLLVVIVVLLVSTTVVFAKEEMPTVSGGGIEPFVLEGANNGGNVTCAEVEAYKGVKFDLYGEKVDYEDGDFSTPEGVSVTVLGKLVTFDLDSSTYKVAAAIVKGGRAANVFYYDPAVLSDSGLFAPANDSGGPAGLSNITFCFVKVEVQPEQWCSPGYWKQDQHLGSWALTGYAPTDKFAAVFGYTAPAKKNSTAIPNATLLDVLRNPQIYGGELTNLIADRLSNAHPDINYLGNRVEGSCPLGRAE